MAVRVALGPHDARQALVGDTHEVVGAGGGTDRVHRNLHGTRGSVLEADGARQTRGKLAMELRLGGACADGPPGDGVSRVLRGDGVEKLRPRRHPHLVAAHQQLACDTQALVDVVGAVEVRVVDQALPPHRRPGLLEVDSHDDDELLRVLLDEGSELAGVLLGGLDVVDGARAADDDDAVIGPLQDVLNSCTRVQHSLPCLGGEGDLLLEAGGGQERADIPDASVFRALLDK
mmetsp:Transcript_17284/g.34488  ORF Transcript_17284/g.34488 Transcript_17284/m.34488 type:complete len:232 (+) Transcript_17284:438-1133(+)